jgi:hypothetical protein
VLCVLSRAHSDGLTGFQECGNPFEEAYLLKEGQPHHMECYKLALLRTL